MQTDLEYMSVREITVDPGLNFVIAFFREKSLRGEGELQRERETERERVSHLLTSRLALEST